tara:strand:- start:2829 stop:3287 length:459 start_codon:yes stop_codon:yes gene_type:complete
MAETQEPSTGWGGEFWLSTDETAGNAVELVQVLNFQIPEVTVEQVETTHLKSPNQFREFIDALAEGGEVEIPFNFRPGSDTDEMLDDWEAARGKRYAHFNVPIGGTPVKTYSGTFSFAGYNRGTIQPGEKMEASLRVKLSGPLTTAAYSAPA